MKKLTLGSPSLGVPCSVRIVALVAPVVASLVVVSGEDQLSEVMTPLVVVIRPLVVLLWSLLVAKSSPPVTSGALDEGIAWVVVVVPISVDCGTVSVVVPISVDGGIVWVVVPISVDGGIVSVLVPISVGNDAVALEVIPRSDSDTAVVDSNVVMVLDGNALDPLVALGVGSDNPLVEALGGIVADCVVVVVIVVVVVVPAHSRSAFSSVVKHTTAMANPHVLSMLSITFAHAAMFSSAPVQLVPYMLVLEDCWIV